jgi:hypothetical protein
MEFADNERIEKYKTKRKNEKEIVTCSPGGPLPIMVNISETIKQTCNFRRI